MVKPYLFHCHVKDWIVEDKSKNKKRSRLLGEGELPWPTVLKALLEIGYEGYISDEYEKYWYPKLLPDAEIGMKHNLEYLKGCVIQIQIKTLGFHPPYIRRLFQK